MEVVDASAFEPEPLDPDLFDEARARAAGWRYLTVRPVPGQDGDELEQIARALQECAGDCDCGWDVGDDALVLGICSPDPAIAAELIGHLEDEVLAIDPRLELEDGAL